MNACRLLSTKHIEAESLTFRVLWILRPLQDHCQR